MFLILFKILVFCTTHVINSGNQHNENSVVDILSKTSGFADYQSELMNPYVEESINFEITSLPDWPDRSIQFGQVSGVTLDTVGNVYVFHRGDKKWDINSFLPNETFNEINLGPISKSTVAVINPITGALMYEWGSQMFYLPHGITVDFDNNLWVTDVAMHQVLKFPPLLNSEVNNTKPLLTLGNKFIPGSDLGSFCKPTAVAVLSSGEFFVSDGYCNSRIIKYSPDGNVILHWGRPSLSPGGHTALAYHFSVPHDLTLAEDKNLIYVADRENGRIQCFRTTNGSFVYQIQSNDIGFKIYSVSYTPVNGGLLFIVNGPDQSSQIKGTVVNAYSDSGRILKTFNPNVKEEPNFENPHDIIVSPNGTSIFVTELQPFRVWKFKIDGLSVSSSLALSKNTGLPSSNQTEDGSTSGSMLMAMFITAVVLCFGAVLLTSALLYSRRRTRGRSISEENLMLDSNIVFER